MRSLPEWCGKTDDDPIPPRVRIRIFERFSGQCQCGCTRKILPGDAWECDHIISLCNGGLHAESNLHPLLKSDHIEKSRSDVAEKSSVYTKKLKHRGIRKRSKFAYSRDSVWKKTFNHGVVRR